MSTLGGFCGWRAEVQSRSSECGIRCVGRTERHIGAVERLLDGLADLVGQREHQHRVVDRLGVVGIRADRLAELDAPLRRQRDRAQRAEQREERRHREVRQAQHPREELDVADLRIDLLGADDRHRDDRHPGPQRRLDEPAPAEALQLVARRERLSDALEPFRPYADELPLAEQAFRVGGAGQRLARLARERADQRHLEHQVRAEPAQVAAAGLVVDRDRSHQRVQGQHTGVVRDQQGTALGGQVRDTEGVDAEPLAVQRAQRRQDHRLGQLGVEAELVDGVVAGQPVAQEPERRARGLGQRVHGRRVGRAAARERDDRGGPGLVLAGRVILTQVCRGRGRGVSFGGRLLPARSVQGDDLCLGTHRLRLAFEVVVRSAHRFACPVAAATSTLPARPARRAPSSTGRSPRPVM